MCDKATFLFVMRRHCSKRKSIDVTTPKQTNTRFCNVSDITVVFVWT